MRRWGQMVCLVIGLIGTGAGAAPAGVFTTLDISGVSTGRLQGRHPLYPSGPEVILGAVPFNIPEVGMNTWFAAAAAGGGSGIVSVTIPIGLTGVTGIHTLINTLWGVAGRARAGLRFSYDDGTIYDKPLIGDEDIRDYYANTFTNSINGTTTVRVFFTDVDGPFGPNRYRLDKQFIDLSAFQDKMLTSMTLIDGGNEEVQRTFLAGVTVESMARAAVPEPSSLLTLATGAAGLVGVRSLRRRRGRAGLAPRLTRRPARAGIAAAAGDRD